MARIVSTLSLFGLGLALVGCVPLEKYNALKLERDQLTERVNASDAAARAAQAENDLLKKQLEGLAGSKGDFQGLITNLTTQNQDLVRQLAEMNEKYRNVQTGASGPLPVALTNELSAFAAQNPDLVDFDAARGIVKFKSDVTFAKGDAELTPKAKEVIVSFAKILNSGIASNYELLVAGHTDSTPVNNPATIARGHRNNWYLSAHRAISVGNELISQRVGSNRLGVVGYADQRPAASNSSESGMAQNRRVEVIILPTAARSGPVASTPARELTHTGKHAAPKFNKDTPVEKKAPLNK